MHISLSHCTPLLHGVHSVPVSGSEMLFWNWMCVIRSNLHAYIRNTYVRTYIHMYTCSVLPLSCLFCTAVCWAGQWHCTHTACRKWNKSTLAIHSHTQHRALEWLWEGQWIVWILPSHFPCHLAWWLQRLAPEPASLCSISYFTLLWSFPLLFPIPPTQCRPRAPCLSPSCILYTVFGDPAFCSW